MEANEHYIDWELRDKEIVAGRIADNALRLAIMEGYLTSRGLAAACIKRLANSPEAYEMALKELGISESQYNECVELFYLDDLGKQDPMQGNFRHFLSDLEVLYRAKESMN